MLLIFAIIHFTVAVTQKKIKCKIKIMLCRENISVHPANISIYIIVYYLCKKATWADPPPAFTLRMDTTVHKALIHSCNVSKASHKNRAWACIYLLENDLIERCLSIFNFLLNCHVNRCVCVCVREKRDCFLTEPTCFAQPALWFKYKRSLKNTMIGCKTATHSRRKRKEKKIQARSNTDSKPPETNKGFPDRSLWDQSGITFIFIYLFQKPRLKGGCVRRKFAGLASSWQKVLHQRLR